NDITVIDQNCALFSYSDATFPSAPDAIALLNPDNNALDQPTTLTLAWTADPAADTYHLQVATSSSFSEIVFENANLTQTGRQVGPLLDGRTYYWRVLGENTAGTGPWSDIYSFTTLTPQVPPDVVVLDDPLDNVVNMPTAITFDWEGTAGASEYHLQVSTTEDFSEIVFENDNLVSTRRTVTSLDNNTTYYWRVRAANQAGAGPWSDVRRLTTAPPLPGVVTPRSPQNDATGVPPTVDLAWDPVPGAASYDVQVGTTFNFSQIVFDGRGIEGTTVQVGPLEVNRKHFWQVRAVNVAGVGEWSARQRFTTALVAPGVIGLISPDDEAADQPLTVAFEWEAEPNADAYHFQLSTTEDFSEIVYQGANLSQTTTEVADLSGNTVYVWRVRGKNTVGTGPWSDVRRFTTMLTAPGPVALVAPDDGAIDLPGIVPLEWEALADVDAYHLQVSTTEDFSQIVFDRDDLTETMTEVGPLAYLTTHYWRVHGKNAVGDGPWSGTRRFTLAVGTGVESLGDGIPGQYRLHQNYPNPFNPATTLRFDLPESAHVSLVIYDMLGRVVETLVSDTLPAGEFSFAWDATHRPSGIYLARLQTGTFSQTRQLLLLK
ncbi:MAG: fibronectin type III domain-containing protein, partial [Rhodothermales bacterium]